MRAPATIRDCCCRNFSLLIRCSSARSAMAPKRGKGGKEKRKRKGWQRWQRTMAVNDERGEKRDTKKFSLQKSFHCSHMQYTSHITHHTSRITHLAAKCQKKYILCHDILDTPVTLVQHPCHTSHSGKPRNSR